jgi:ABC-type spermidine/putrescine transport system permease subunit I
MGAWWANDSTFWYAVAVVLGALIAAFVVIYLIARAGRDRRQT